MNISPVLRGIVDISPVLRDTVDISPVLEGYSGNFSCSEVAQWLGHRIAGRKVRTGEIPTVPL